MSYVLEFGACSSFKVPQDQQFVFDKVKTDIVNDLETFTIALRLNYFQLLFPVQKKTLTINQFCVSGVGRDVVTTSRL